MAFRDEMKLMSREDRAMIGQAILDICDNGEITRSNRKISDVPSLGFACRQMSMMGGRKDIGLLTVYSVVISDDEVVVLFAKAGGHSNLSFSELDRIREIHAFEIEFRGLRK